MRRQNIPPLATLAAAAAASGLGMVGRRQTASSTNGAHPSRLSGSGPNLHHRYEALASGTTSLKNLSRRGIHDELTTAACRRLLKPDLSPHARNREEATAKCRGGIGYPTRATVLARRGGPECLRPPEYRSSSSLTEIIFPITKITRDAMMTEETRIIGCKGHARPGWGFVGRRRRQPGDRPVGSRSGLMPWSMVTARQHKPALHVVDASAARLRSAKDGLARDAKENFPGPSTNTIDPTTRASTCEISSHWSSDEGERLPDALASATMTVSSSIVERIG